MIEQPTQPRTHELALQARGGRLPPQGRPAAVILDSWARSLRAGVDAHAPAQVPVVEAVDLAHRRTQAAHVRRLAQAQLETLSQQIAGSNFLLAFADHDGVILDLYADHRFSTSGDNAGIVAGSVWRESLCGTNGLGTALATGAPVAVSGLEHYSLALGDLSCTAAPVRNAHGDIVGALDASSYYDTRQRHTQALVQMAATHIENDLLLHQMRRQTVLALHPRAEYLGTLSAGLLAFDGDGRLQALNARARQILAGLNPVAGTAFEALFGAAFDRVLTPLPVGAELRLHDVLGSALVARVLHRPAPDWPTAASLRRAAPAPMTPLPGRSTTPPAAPARAPLRITPPDFVADDPAVIEVCRTVQGAVRLAVPVLIQGETGSGKELLARHAHELSGRRGAFVAVNCGALPDELFEAELFGHVGGAFTGARREGSIGLIASADGGTLLLDEVRELPMHLQAALLRFLDDRLVRPVGGTQSRRVDVQLLAASPVDLAEEVAARRFRDDLMYRLAIVKVTLPPLRQRRDFDRAARHVLATLDANARLSDAALARLARHDWPGNFRELRAVLTRALLARQVHGDPLGTIDADELAPLLLPAGVSCAASASALQHSADALVRLEFERCGGNVSRTSRNLGISRTTVYRHLRDAGVPGI